jgi:aminopeptidase N
VLGPFRTFGGMEYPELVLTTTDPAAVVHETAHQWWYGTVGGNQHAEPWLDESFATFAHRRVLGGLERCAVTDPLGRRWGAGPLNAPMTAFEARPSHLGRVYGGGACALESLRRAWGTARFDRMLRRFADRHRFGVATTASFLAAVRDAAPAGFDVERWRRRVRLV